MDNEQHYKGIKRSIVGTVILVSFTPLLLIMAVSGYEFHTAYSDKVFAYLEQLVEKHALDIDYFLDERLANLLVLSELYSFEQLSDQEKLAEILHALQEKHGGVFVDLGVVDSKGQQIAYAGPFKLGKADYADAAWFKEASKRRYYISDVFLGLRGLQHFIVAAKFEGENDQIQSGLIRATIDFVAFNALVENIRMGETGMAFIINKEGEFQTQTGINTPSYAQYIKQQVWGRTEQNAQYIPLETLESFTSFRRRSGSYRVNVLFQNDPGSGQDTLYVTTRLKDSNWALVYKQNKEDAFRSVFIARNKTIAVCFVGGIAILIMAYILASRVTSRIAEGDRAKEIMNEKVIEAGRLASIGELAAGIAHEINNPVAIMVEEAGWIGDVLEEPEFGETENVNEIEQAIKQIKSQGSRCKQITHKLLSFARKTDYVEKTVQMNELVKEVIELAGDRARYENIKTNLELAPDLPIVVASPNELQQILLNLYNNAIDAIDKKTGGTVSIRTRKEVEDVVVEIEDNGQGIPGSNLKRIFDPFFTTKPVGKGTGLGLSICYGIVEKMGGNISVRSAVGVGTTFYVRLPLIGEKQKSTDNNSL